MSAGLPPGGWMTEYLREDGALVVPSPGEQGAWAVILPTGHRLALCPCCKKPLRTPGVARLVVDKYMPQEPNDKE